MRIHVFALFLAFVSSLSSAQGAAEKKPGKVYEWPMIVGGGGRIGYSADERVRPPFRLKWATQPGCGTSMEVAVAAGKIFTPSCCLDAETGEVLWKADLGNGVPAYYKGKLYSGKGRITAYDATNGKRLWSKPGYNLTRGGKRSGLTVWEGAIYAARRADHNGKQFYFLDSLDTETGKVKWSTPLIEVVETKRKGYHLGMTMGMPAVAGGIVVTTTHSPKMAFALDVKTGKELWRQKDMSVWSSPSTDGKSVWVAERMQGVVAMDAKTGKRLWQWGGKTGDLIKANYAKVGTAKYPPVFAYGKLFTQNYGRRYTALDAKTGKELWIAGDNGGHAWAGTCGPPSAAGGYIYTNGTVGKDFNGKNYRFVVAAADHKTGKAVWRSPIAGKACARAPIAYGRLYPIGGTEIYCFEPVPADYKNQPQPPPEKPAALPAPLAKPFAGKPGTAAAGGKPKGGTEWPMYGGSPARCGLDVKIGLPVKYAWKYQTGGKVKSSPVIAGGMAFAGSDSGKLVALDLSTGKKKWEAEIGSWVRCAPAVAKGIVVCGADDGVLRAFDAQTGKPKWQFKTAAQIRSSPAVVGDRVVFGSWDGHCYCVRLTDGKEFWRWRTAPDVTVRVYAPPAVANGRVYVGAWEDRKVHALDLGTGKPLAGYTAPSGYGSKVGLVQGLAVYRGMIVTCRDRPGCHLIDPNSGKVALKNPRMGIGWGNALMPALPAFSGDRAFHPGSLVGGSIVKALSKDGPAKLSRADARKNAVFNAPLVGGDLLIAATSKGTLEARKIPEGKGAKAAAPVWEWKSPSGAEIHTAPAAAAGFIVVGSDDGHVYGFSYSQGE